MPRKNDPRIANGNAQGLTDKEIRARRERPQKMDLASMTSRIASMDKRAMGADISEATQQGFFSVQLSTDFLEKPQSQREEWELYRWFYDNHPIVGQALDLHTELPLSKIRLMPPQTDDHKKRQMILKFFEEMCDRLEMLHRLIEMSHEYNLLGNGFIFAEDSETDSPPEIRIKEVERSVDGDGNAVEKAIEWEDADEREAEWMQAHYKGWERLTIIPPEQVKITTLQFSPAKTYELIVDSRTRQAVEEGSFDPEAARLVEHIPEELKSQIRENEGLLKLDTDPNEGSFIYHLAKKKSQYQDWGVSMLRRCLNDLIYYEKLRQAQTQIASRAMTPKRVVWGEDLSDTNVDDLRAQVDQALLDPDFSIVANYQVNWEEIGSRDRLIDTASEYDQINRNLYAGLGVTESMLSGESAYSGDRIKVEIINTRYLLFREILQQYVENYLFKPVAKKKGFVEVDEETGEERVLYPKLSFTRLALRDNQDTFDALFNLYQKGSLSVDFILELFNIDPDTVREQLKEDLFTVNDSTFNEVIRGIAGETGRAIVENTDISEKIAKYLSLEWKQKSEEDRF